MGGRGSSSGGGGKVSISDVRDAQKAVTKAKSAETRAYNNYLKASGKERMTTAGRPELSSERRSERNNAYRNYVQKKEQRQNAEKNLDRLSKRFRRGR